MTMPASSAARPRSAVLRALVAGATLVSLATTLVVAVWAERRFEQSAQLVEHTMTVRSAISDLTTTLLRAESSTRGYALTGRADQLVAYTAAKERALWQVERIRSLIADNGTQQRLLVDVAALVAVQLDHLQRTVEGNVELRDADALDGKLREMAALENTLLATRREGQRRSASLVLASLAASGVTLGLFLTIGFMWARAAAARRRATESDAARLRAEVEVLNERRLTAEFQERFVAILGHDLRNPLAALTMGLRVLRASPPPAHVRTLDRLERTAARMTRMIDQLVDLARSRLAGGIPVRPERADLARIVADVTEEARVAHPDFSIVTETEGDVQGEWDSDRLAQVVSNLVENAISHGAADVPVFVRVRGEGRGVVLAVHNAGPPVPRDLAPLIFDPFRRGERYGTTARTSGLGLGLYIARQIVSAHSGTIDVTSTHDDGTTFTVELPRTAEQRARPGGGG